MTQANSTISSTFLGLRITNLSISGEFRILNLRTFFSNRHKTFSRIKLHISQPILISILPILLSDHSAVLCSVPLSDVIGLSYPSEK